MKQASAVKRTPVKSRATASVGQHDRKPKNRLETPLAETSYSNGSFYQKVEEVAYQLYLARGCAHGYDVEDWLAAEQIVRGS